MSKKRAERDDETLDQGELKMTREQPPSVFLNQLRSGGDLRNVDGRDDDNEILDIENREFTAVHYEGFNFDFDRPINFQACVFDNAHFENTTGRFAFINCLFRESFFTDATLKNCVFFKCNFLGDTNFERANLQNAKFHDCILNKVAFKNANLQEAEFNLVVMNTTYFDEGCNLQQAIFIDCKIKNTTFANAILTGSLFRGTTTLQIVYFNNANLNNVSFLGILNFFDVYFENADVNGIQFRPTYQYFNLNSLFQTGLDFSNTTAVICENCALELSAFQLTRAEFLDCEFTDTISNCTFNQVLFMRCLFDDLIIAETNQYNNNTGFSDCSFLGASLANCDLRNVVFHDLQPDKFDDQTDFTNAQLPPNLLTFLRNLPPDNRPIGIPAFAEPPVVGVAFEIHNAFNKLNLNGIYAFLKAYNQQHPNDINPNTRPQQLEIRGDDFALRVLKPLVYFIYNSGMYNDDNFKNEKLNDFNAIYNRIRRTDSLADKMDVIDACIDFVVRQDNDFIEQYINILTQDCMHAYSGENQASCSAGMVERLITVLNEAAKIRLQDPQLADDKRLLYEQQVSRMFKTIDDLSSQWNEEFIGNEEKRQQLLDTLKTKEERKQQFVDYIAQNYEPYIDDAFRQNILNYANSFDYMFENLELGGSRKKRRHHKKTKKARRKSKRKQTHKKHRTQRKKYRKRTNISKKI